MFFLGFPLNLPNGFPPPKYWKLKTGNLSWPIPRTKPQTAREVIDEKKTEGVMYEGVFERVQKLTHAYQKPHCPIFMTMLSVRHRRAQLPILTARNETQQHCAASQAFIMGAE